DHFELTGNGTITGLINGGSGVGDSIDLTGVANERDLIVQLGDIVNDHLNILNIETVEANGDNHTLIGDNRANTWNITGTDAGQIDHTDNTQEHTSTAFSGFAFLRGGS